MSRKSRSIRRISASREAQHPAPPPDAADQVHRRKRRILDRISRPKRDVTPLDSLLFGVTSKTDLPTLRKPSRTPAAKLRRQKRRAVKASRRRNRGVKRR